MASCDMLNVTPSSAGRFRPERLFQPKSVVVFGADTPIGAVAWRNLQAGGFKGTLAAADPTPQAVRALTAAPDLAVIGTADAGPLLQALGAAGTTAALALADVPNLLGHAQASSVRVLGPRAFGIAVPSLGLDATVGHLAVRPGRLALVSQSRSLCRAVMDWAEPNGVGFSMVVGTGGNADIGFGLVLDWLSRDSGTGAILLDMRSLLDRRAFLSAARAAARLRPVVALHAGGRLHDPSGWSDRVLDAALHRVGVLRVDRFADLLAAAETLSAARPARSDQVAIVTNAIGPGQMAADFAVGAGVALWSPSPELRAAMRLPLPTPYSEGLIQLPAHEPTRLAETAAMLSAVPEVGGVVVVMAPSGPADGAGIAALAAAQPTMRLPLLAGVLGETTGAAHRRTLAAAAVPAFATPEQAMRGFIHLQRQRQARIAARELPASDVLAVSLDAAGVGHAIAAARAADRVWLNADEVAAVMAAAGLRGSAEWRIRVADDALFGPAITFGDPDLVWDTAVDLPPLNLPLAAAMAARSTRSSAEAVAALVRVSQLFVAAPSLAELDLGPGGNAIRLRPPGELGRLAIAPYPAELTERWHGRGEPLTVRPIRPEDADAHRALFAGLSPQDVRFRFFSALRELSDEQVARMTDIDYDREMALVAVRDTGETVAVCRLVREPYTPQAEFAIVVTPDWKGGGLGRHLMERITQWAAGRGVQRVVGQVLAENAPMLAFMRRIGFRLRRMPDEPDVVEAAMDVSPADPGRIATERSPASIRNEGQSA